MQVFRTEDTSDPLLSFPLFRTLSLAFAVELTFSRFVTKLFTGFEHLRTFAFGGRLRAGGEGGQGRQGAQVQQHRDHQDHRRHLS